MYYNDFGKLQSTLKHIEKYKEVFLVDIDTMVSGLNENITSFPTTPNYFLMKTAGAYKDKNITFTYVPSLELYNIVNQSFNDEDCLFIGSSIIESNFYYFKNNYFNNENVDNFFIGGILDDYPDERIKKAVPEHSVVELYKELWNDYPSNLIIFSIGCPGKCHFCYTRHRTVAYGGIVDLENIKKYVVFKGKPLIIMDESFGSYMDIDELRAVMEYFKKNKIKFAFRNGFNLKFLPEEKIALILEYRDLMTVVFLAWDTLEQDRPLMLLKKYGEKLSGSTFLFMKTKGLEPLELKKSYLSGLYRGLWVTYYGCRPKLNPELDWSMLKFTDPIDLVFYNMFWSRMAGNNKSTPIPVLCLSLGTRMFEQGSKCLEMLSPKFEGDTDYRNIMNMYLYDVTGEFLYALGKYIECKQVDKHFSDLPPADYHLPEPEKKDEFRIKIDGFPIALNPYIVRVAEKKVDNLDLYFGYMEKQKRFITAEDYMKKMKKSFSSSLLDDEIE